MCTTTRDLLHETAVTGAGGLNSAAIARRHRIERTVATPGLFAGMLLGNGAIGVCVTIRADALRSGIYWAPPAAEHPAP